MSVSIDTSLSVGESESVSMSMIMSLSTYRVRVNIRFEACIRQRTLKLLRSGESQLEEKGNVFSMNPESLLNECNAPVSSDVDF